jgi:hypothetical protein
MKIANFADCMTVRPAEEFTKVLNKNKYANDKLEMYGATCTLNLSFLCASRHKREPKNVSIGFHIVAGEDFVHDGFHMDIKLSIKSFNEDVDDRVLIESYTFKTSDYRKSWWSSKLMTPCEVNCLNNNG